MRERDWKRQWPWLAGGIAMAVAYWLLADDMPRSAFVIALKGGSVAALAGFALARGREREAKLIAAVMAVGATGDIGVELSTAIGGGLFLLAHLIAIALYWPNRRPHPAGSQRMAAAALLFGVPLGAWVLSQDPLPVIYAAGLGTMAATAWLSRFSRYRVGIGALLFVGSDMLIFARLGGRLGEGASSWLVWPLYYAGQLLICTGVIRLVAPARA